MECLDTTKSLKINFKKKINLVVLVVEGAEYEFDLFKYIFRNILHYSLVTKSRNMHEFKEYNEFVMKGNEDSRIVIINTKNSNIGSITDDETYRNELYIMLYEKYNIDIKNVPVYYIWDRDRNSNDEIVVYNLLSKLDNAYDNEEYENGLLLLSYPCSESYTISCFEKDKNKLNGNIKEYLKDKGYYLNKIDRNMLKNAVIEMYKHLKLINVDFNIDNMKNTNIDAFNKEETYYLNNKTYILLSFISVVLLDLGIITFR